MLAEGVNTSTSVLTLVRVRRTRQAAEDHHAAVGQQHLVGTSARGACRAARSRSPERVERVDLVQALEVLGRVPKARLPPVTSRRPSAMNDWPRTRCWPASARRRQGRARAAGRPASADPVRGPRAMRVPCSAGGAVAGVADPGFFGYENQMTLPVGSTAAWTAITGIENGAPQRPTSAGSPTGAQAGAVSGRRRARRGGSPFGAGRARCVGGAQHPGFERAQPSLAHPRNAEAAAVSVRRRSLRPGEALADRGLRSGVRAGLLARAVTAQRKQSQRQAGQSDERTGRQELAQE